MDPSQHATGTENINSNRSHQAGTSVDQVIVSHGGSSAAVRAANTGPLVHDDGKFGAEAYFRSCGFDVARVHVLCRGLESFLPAETIDDAQIEGLSWPPITAAPGNGEDAEKARAGRLNELWTSINQSEASHHALLRRLLLLFVEHEVAALEPPLTEKSKFRVKKRAVAIGKLERAMRSVKDLLHKGKKYMALVKIAGPGALLEIGSQNVGLWEREIKEAEVVVIHEYRSQLPGYVKSGRRHKWDFVVARLLVLGMVAYGWKYGELAEGRTELTDQLRAYIDFPSLRRGEIRTQSTRPRRAETAPLSHQEMQGGHGLISWQALPVPTISGAVRGLLPAINSGSASGANDDCYALAAREEAPGLIPDFDSLAVFTDFRQVGSSHWSCVQQSMIHEWQTKTHLSQEIVPEGAWPALRNMKAELRGCTWVDFQSYFTINKHQREECLEKCVSALAQSYTVLHPAARYTVVYFKRSQWLVPLGSDVLIPLCISAATAPSLSKQPLRVYRAVSFNNRVYLDLGEELDSGVMFLWLHPSKKPASTSALAPHSHLANT